MGMMPEFMPYIQPRREGHHSNTHFCDRPIIEYQPGNEAEKRKSLQVCKPCKGTIVICLLNLVSRTDGSDEQALKPLLTGDAVKDASFQNVVWSSCGLQDFPNLRKFRRTFAGLLKHVAEETALNLLGALSDGNNDQPEDNLSVQTQAASLQASFAGNSEAAYVWWKDRWVSRKQGASSDTQGKGRSSTVVSNQDTILHSPTTNATTNAMPAMDIPEPTAEPTNDTSSTSSSAKQEVISALEVIQSQHEEYHNIAVKTIMVQETLRRREALLLKSMAGSADSGKSQIDRDKVQAELESLSELRHRFEGMVSRLGQLKKTWMKNREDFLENVDRMVMGT